MIIASFDVGIKNLALCLFEIHDNYKDLVSDELNKKNSIYKLLPYIKILKWDVINLSNDSIKQKCSCINKNGKKCNSISKFIKNNIYYCNKHAISSKYIIPNKDNNLSNIKNKKKDEVINFCKEKNIIIKNCENKNKFFYVNLIKKYFNDYTLDKIQTTNMNKLDMVTIGKNIRNKLNMIEIPNLILIENQIGNLANRMKTVQGLLTQYFIMNNIENIEFLSSSNKLKFFLNKNEKTTYKDRKNLGISLIKNNILSKLNTTQQLKWTEHFNNHNKKDDLADSILQSLYYLVK